jgi:hypothetical protein
MMSGMMGGMVWGSVLAVLLLLGFAYIIWVQASKEEGATKSAGQVIAIIIAAIAIAILLYGTIYGGVMGRGGWCGGYQRYKGAKGYKHGMMRYMEKMPEGERHEMMEEMMKKYRR